MELHDLSTGSNQSVPPFEWRGSKNRTGDYKMKDLISLWIGNLLTVHTGDPEQARRGRLLGVLLLGTTAATFVVTLANIQNCWANGFSETASVYLVADLATLLVLIGALHLNRIGRTKLASYVLLTLLIAGAPSFEFSNADHLALLYVIPTTAASFFIGPSASFLFAALSSIGYTIGYTLSDLHAESYNYLPVIGLFMIALVAWMVASSLNNALRQVRQHAEELDRRVMERTRELAEALQHEHTAASTTQAILQSIGDGVIVFDQNRRAILINPAALAILERREGDVLGKTVSRIMGEAVSEEDQAIVRSLIESKEPPSASLKIAWGRKTMAVGFGSIKLPITHQFGSVVVLRDITKEVEVDQMKSDFVSIVSHELRTPMTAIKGYVDLLAMGSAGAVTEKQRNFLGTIKTNTDRLSEMVNELLDLSRIEAGEAQMHLRSVPLRHIVNEVVMMLERSFHDRGIQLYLNIPDNLPDVLSDPIRLAQIITNLLSNALKYTFEGHVNVTAHVVGDKVQVEIADTGIGMTEQDQAKLFTRFFRTSAARAREIPGTGLGLSITRSLIELHGGRIWVKSAVDQGSTFSFTLPIVPEPLAQMAPTASSPTIEALPRATPKILIVNNELHIAQLFRHELETDGYTILITTSGAGALPLAQHEQPDLISLDAVLPNGDGLELLRQLKQDPLTQFIPVIVTSSVGDEEKAIALGAADYITKPMDSHQMLTSVRRVLAADASDNKMPRPVLAVAHEADTPLPEP
jgi:PAS domain S-box-containing protein